MRRSEPVSHERKVMGRADRDNSVPKSQTYGMRTGERELSKATRRGTTVPPRLRERVELPSEDGDMFRPDPECDDLVC